MSIFQKVCPGCASSVSVSIERCDCGYSFSSADNSQSPLEATLHDEELYAGYLAARAEQARQAADSAEWALSQDSSNPDLAAAAALAQEVARAIDNDLKEQQTKIAAIKKVLNEMQPLTSAPAPMVTNPAPIASTNPVLAQNKARASAPATASVNITDGKARIQPAKQKSKAVTAKPAAVSATQTSSAQKVADVLAALKKAKAKETTAPAQQTKAAVKADKAPAPAVATANTQSTVPPSSFREEQASRAVKIMEAHKSVDGKECPNCTSFVPVNTTKCQCGFAFVAATSDLPSLTLCTGDFTALRDSFIKLNLR